MIEIHSAGIARIPFLEALLGAPVRRGNALAGLNGKRPDAVAGWGLRPSAQTARKRAAQWDVPYLALEDGFLRSFGTGADYPGISMVVDPEGIYYDGTRPSALESMLASDRDLLDGIEDDVDEAMALVALVDRASNHRAEQCADQAGAHPLSHGRGQQRGGLCRHRLERRRNPGARSVDAWNA